MAEPSSTNDDLRPEYDATVFAGAARGKYVAKYKSGTNVVQIAPDVAASFPTEQAVNEALRFVLRIANDAERLTGR
jgi:hypothetical protein